MFCFYLSLTVKNLWRRKRRTLLTAAAIAFGIMYFAVFDSMLTGLDQDAIANMIDFETGHVQAIALSGHAPGSAGSTVDDSKALAEAAAKLPGVEGATLRRSFPGSVAAGADELPLTVVAVDPLTDGQVFRTPEFVAAGGWLDVSQRGGAVLGARVAELLEVSVGDVVSIRTAAAGPGLMMQSVDVTVVGTVNTPHPEVNQSQMFVPLELAWQELNPRDEDIFVTVRARSGSRQSADALACAIRGLPEWNGSWRLQPWHEATSFLAIGASKRSFALALLGLVLIIATIGVVNSILLSTLERVREIGILKAMGMKERQIVTLFVLEGGGLGLIGGLLGVVMSVAANAYLVNVGISLRAIMGDMDIDIGYPVADTMRGVWNWPTMLAAAVFGLVVSLVASYIPARRAAGLDAVKGLRQL